MRFSAQRFTAHASEPGMPLRCLQRSARVVVDKSATNTIHDAKQFIKKAFLLICAAPMLRGLC